MTLLLVLLSANCAGSPTLRRSGSLLQGISASIPRYRSVLDTPRRGGSTVRRCHYRLAAESRIFYAACFTRYIPKMLRAHLGVCTDAQHYIYIRALNRFSEQLCLPGPPGPFVVALPRLNLYKWVRASFLSVSFCLFLPVSLFHSFFLSAYSRRCRRLSKHPSAQRL